MPDPTDMEGFVRALNIGTDRPAKPEPDQEQAAEQEPTKDDDRAQQDEARARAVAEAGLPDEYGTFLEGVEPDDVPDRIQKLQALAGHRRVNEPEHVRIARAALEHAAKSQHQSPAEVAALTSAPSRKPGHAALLSVIHPGGEAGK